MTRLRDKIPPVAPLDELRIARIEQRVLAAAEGRESVRRRPSRAIGWAVAAVAVAGVALAVFLNWRGSQRGEVALPTPAAPAPMRVQTGSDSARIGVGDAVVVVGPNSDAEISRNAGEGTSVWLERGRVDCEVEPHTARAPFIVRAGKVDVTVVGTVFSVERTGDEVKVRVTRGKVKVAGKGAVAEVAAGQQWAELSGTIALAPEAVAPVETAAEKPAAATASERGQATAGGEPAVAGRTPAEVAATPRAATSERAGERVEKKPPVDHEPRAEGRGEAPPVGSADLDAAFELEERDPAGAAAVYRKTAFEKTGAVASWATYRLAWLQFHRLGQLQEAIETTDLYRRRFRGGREAERALWLRVQALCKVGEQEACRAAAHTFRERYPESAHADEASRIVNQ